MATVYYWRIHCIAEDIDVFVWSETAPIICPNDHVDRTIDSTRTVQLGTITEEQVKVKDPGAGKPYLLEPEVVNVPSGTPGDVYIHDFSRDMDIDLWQVDFYSKATNIGDVLNIIINPDVIVGYLTQGANIGENVLHVPQASAESSQILKGYEILLDDSVNTEDLGRITAIDKDTYTFTTKNTLTQNFSAGTLVKLNAYAVRNKELHEVEKFSLGKKGLGFTPLLAGTVARIKYTNNDGLAKKFCLDIHQYYS